MKRFFLLSLVICAFAYPVLAQPVDKIVVSGEPPISMDVIKSHIKLMEFVLNARMTTAQKNRFLEDVKNECADMEKSAREDFLQAMDLIKKMAPMDETQKEAVRSVLLKDYEESAGEDETDPAAQLFLKLQESCGKNLAQNGSFTFAIQALEAFEEFVGFSQNPDSPQILTPEQKDLIFKVTSAAFSKFSVDVQETLAGFDRKWHLIKCAWAAAKDDMKGKWAETLKKTVNFESPDFKLNETTIGAVANPNLIKEMTTFAATLGESECGWVATSSVNIW